MKATERIAALLATHEYVIEAHAIGNRVVVTFPRYRGGRHSMTLPEAKRLVKRLGLDVEVPA